MRLRRDQDLLKAVVLFPAAAQADGWTGRGPFVTCHPAARMEEGSLSPFLSGTVLSFSGELPAHYFSMASKKGNPGVDRNSSIAAFAIDARFLRLPQPP